MLYFKVRAAAGTLLEDAIKDALSSAELLRRFGLSGW